MSTMPLRETDRRSSDLPTVHTGLKVIREIPTVRPKPFLDLDADNEEEDTGLTSNAPSELLARQREFVLTCLDEGIDSVRVICELMIKRQLASRERLLTGKPAFSPLVCIFLEEMRCRTLDKDIES